MNIKIDTHTHTVASGHAYASLNEMVSAAKDAGLEIMATTDHAPNMPGSTHIFYFQNLKVIPEYINGVRVLKGIEANIIDYKGGIDVPNSILSALDLVIASFHSPCITLASEKEVTKCLYNVMNNKYINIIGHPEDSRFKFDYNSIVKHAKDTNTLIEVNNSSLLPTTFRENSREGIIKILEECAKHETYVVLGSDAHYTSSVGKFDAAISLLNEIDFPKKLLVNSDVSLFNKILNGKK